MSLDRASVMSRYVGIMLASAMVLGFVGGCGSDSGPGAGTAPPAATTAQPPGQPRAGNSPAQPAPADQGQPVAGQPASPKAEAGNASVPPGKLPPKSRLPRPGGAKN